MVPTLLYGSETWTIYRRHLKALEQYQQRCLRKILRIRWEERHTNTNILHQAKIPITEALATLDQLRWARHIVHMTITGVLYKQVLYSQLRNGRQASGGQRKRFKDTFTGPIDTWESLAQDCQSGGGASGKASSTLRLAVGKKAEA
eukprot:g37509.t1